MRDAHWLDLFGSLIGSDLILALLRSTSTFPPLRYLIRIEQGMGSVSELRLRLRSNNIELSFQRLFSRFNFSVFRLGILQIIFINFRSWQSFHYFSSEGVRFSLFVMDSWN